MTNLKFPNDPHPSGSNRLTLPLSLLSLTHSASQKLRSRPYRAAVLPLLVRNEAFILFRVI